MGLIEIIGLLGFIGIEILLYKLLDVFFERSMAAYDKKLAEERQKAIKEEIAPGVYLLHDVWSFFDKEV